MILAIALLETRSSMTWRISSSPPSRHDTPAILSGTRFQRTKRPDFPFERSLLRRISPIERRNTDLYGETGIEPARLRTGNP